MDIDQLGTASVTIPIAVDSVKDIENYRMTRCTYFSIENSEPASGWALHTAGIDVRFLMLGLSGVITSPPGDDPLFDTPDKLDQLFEVIERNGALYVELNELWLPNELFYAIEASPQRGYVYRIGDALFREAYMLKEEARSDREFMEKIGQMDIPLTLNFSKSETDAILTWNKRQIGTNQRDYHGNPETKLPKKNNNQRPLPPLTR